MSKRRRKKDSGGVPEWVVTYGDMMSLLLTFFILLAAFSELKKEHEYQRVITAVKEAFGYSGGVGVLPVDDPPLRSMLQTLESMAVSQMSEKQVSESSDPGMSGKRTTVRRVQDGLKFTIGGGLTFRPESAELLPGARAELKKIARLLRGRHNKIEIRGHAARKPLSASSGFEDLRDLSYYRAKAVGDYLASEGGLDERTLVLDARGATEPIEARAYTPEEQAVNRRVEIIQTESLVEDLHPDPNYADEEAARGG